MFLSLKVCLVDLVVFLLLVLFDLFTVRTLVVLFLFLVALDLVGISYSC